MIPLRDHNPSLRTPYVTFVLIVLNVLVFLFELYSESQGQLNNLIIAWSIIPYELTTQPLAEIPTLFTAMFMHGGWAHLLGNMLYLFIFGDNLEDQLGHGRFLIFYLVCGLGATAAQVAIDPDSIVPNIGASGAIAGVLGGYLLLFPKARITTLVFRFIAQVPAIVVLGFWFVYQFFSGIFSLSTVDLNTGGVAFFAHIGGFVAGLLLIKPFQIGLSKPYEHNNRFPSRFR